MREALLKMAEDIFLCMPDYSSVNYNLICLISTLAYNLGVILSVNYIISLILRNFRMKQYRSIIKFRHFGFFPMVVYLNLLGINLRSYSIPSFSYP